MNADGTKRTAQMRMSKCMLLAIAAALPAGWLLAQPQKEAGVPPYQDPKLAVEARVADLLKRMTLEEKVAMLAGSGWMESQPNARLGIPAIKMADGPMGVRSWAGQFGRDQRRRTPSASPDRLPRGPGDGRHLGSRPGRAARQGDRARK